jgi:hypothetical protein
MKRVIVVTIMAMLVLWTQPIFAAMSGGDYDILIDVFSTGQGSSASGGDYALESTVGESVVGRIISGTTSLGGGFWQAANIGSLSYTLSESALTLSFGASPTGVVASDSLILTVTTDNSTGYAATISESGNLASGANDIDDVTDGEVTAGSEEYGIRTTGGDGQLATDTAIAGTVTVASNSGTVTDAATTVTFRAAASSGTQAGSYSHTTTFTVAVNP